MPTNVIMPALGMAQDTGRLIRWLVDPEQGVSKGDPLMEIETDKATVEVEAPATGVLGEVTAAEGEEIPVGQVIAVIFSSDEVTPGTRSVSSLAGASPPTIAPPHENRDSPAEVGSPVAAPMAEKHDVDLASARQQGVRVKAADGRADPALHMGRQEYGVAGPPLASPKARRLARERGLDLADMRGSGPEGAILDTDITAAIASGATIPAALPSAPSSDVLGAAPSRVVTVAGASTTDGTIWNLMAKRTTESWTSAPHFYLERSMDATGLVTWHDAIKARSADKTTYTDLIVALVAASLSKHPDLNATWLQDRVVLQSEINIGVAVAVPDGLVVPVLHRAERLSLEQISSRNRELAARAQRGKLEIGDIQGGTFTISNLGMFGIDSFSAILNAGQGAILAVGRIADRVVAVAGMAQVRPVLTVTLTCDHRVIDGARAARFLATLSDFIIEPLLLLGLSPARPLVEEAGRKRSAGSGSERGGVAAS